MAAQGGRASGQRHARQLKLGGAGGARPLRPRLRPRPRCAVGLRAAGTKMEFGGAENQLDQPEMAVPPRRSVSEAGRFAGRLSFAAGLIALYRPGHPTPTSIESGPDRMARRRSPAPRLFGAKMPACRSAPTTRMQDEQVLGESADVRTALAVEPRDGRLQCSCRRPSGSRIISNCSRRSRSARKATGLPVHIEGYPPPLDPRLNVIRVAPDPGVIEVNVHPAAIGTRLVAITAAVYEEARAVPARRRKIHDRRPPHRHRRRQSCRGRRRDAGRLALPPPPGSAQEPRSSTGSATRRCPICSPACSSARPRRRRASTRPAMTRSTNWRSRSRRCRAPAKGTRRPLAGRPALSQPAHRRHRQHPSRRKSASTSSIRPTARPGASGWSSSAPSRCRRTPACRWRSNC